MSTFIETSWLARLAAIAVLSLIGAVLAAGAAGEATRISGQEGALQITATGALAGFLIVFLISYRVVNGWWRPSSASEFSLEFEDSPGVKKEDLRCFFQLRDGRDLTKDWTPRALAPTGKTPSGVRVMLGQLWPGSLIRFTLE